MGTVFEQHVDGRDEQIQMEYAISHPGNGQRPHLPVGLANDKAMQRVGECRAVGLRGNEGLRIEIAEVFDRCSASGRSKRKVVTNLSVRFS